MTYKVGRSTTQVLWQSFYVEADSEEEALQKVRDEDKSIDLVNEEIRDVEDVSEPTIENTVKTSVLTQHWKEE